MCVDVYGNATILSLKFSLKQHTYCGLPWHLFAVHFPTYLLQMCLTPNVSLACFFLH